MLLPRCVPWIRQLEFRTLILQDMNRAFLLRVSYIEIYNESLRDLLNSKKGPLADHEKPTIRTAKVSIPVGDD